MNARSVGTLVVLLVSGTLVGCVGAPSGEIEVSVLVTRDYGKELVLEAVARVAAGSSVLDALVAVADVETAYGGGFVNAIQGIRSGYTGGGGVASDWFYYFNGLLANVGATSLDVRHRDQIQWDYRDWSHGLLVPAFAGAFPEPFVHGIGGVRLPTVVAYGLGLFESAELLAERLSVLGAGEVDVRPLADDAGTPIAVGSGAHLILLGSFEEPLLRDLGRDATRLGLFARAGEDGIELLKADGRAARQSTGAVFEMTQSPWAPEGIGAMRRAVLAVCGASSEAVSNAVLRLLSEPHRFVRFHSVLVEDAEVTPLP